MQKILLSLAILAVTIGVGVGATRAYFSDTETSTGNTFTAGTLDLKTGVGLGDSNITMLTVTNTFPGDLGTATLALKNAGNINGFIDLQPITLVDEENGCNEAEKAEEAGCDGNTNGELSANMNVEMFIDSNSNGANDAGENVYTGLLSGISTLGYDSSIALDAGVTKNFIVKWSIPTTATNNIQSDKSTLGMTFELGQTAGQ